MGEGGARGIMGGRGLDMEEEVDRIGGWKEWEEKRG
jgi:hypothetical protein